MTAPGSSGRPERNPEPRVLRDVKLVWLSLDLYPGPYAELTASSPQALPECVRCPECHEDTEMPEHGSDDELSVFWDHLRTHTTDPAALLGLWVTAMGGA